MEWASEDALDSGVTYNVYKNNVRIDEPNFVDLSNPGANKMHSMQSITGAGQTDLDLIL